MECSGSLTAGVGLVNIRSVDTSGIQYFLVDAANKEKALNGQPFEFSSYKSTENNQYSTCVSDGRPSFRPFANSNSAYMVVRNSNMVSTSMLEFNVQLSCVIYPATMVRMKTSFANEYFTKHYVGYPSTFAFSFVNKWDGIDTWQQGIISLTGVSSTQRAIVVNGVGSMQYFPTQAGILNLRFTYTPNPNVYGGSWDNLDSRIIVNQMASKGSIDIQPGRALLPGESFTVNYKIFDNDGSITPSLDLSKFKIEAYHEKGPRMRDDLVSCMHVMNRRGEGFINCNTSEMIASNFEIRAMFNGVVLDTKTILLDGPVLIFSLTPLQWLFILGICIVIGVVVIGGILLVVYFMRKREKKEMVKLEDPIDNNKELELENMEQPFRNAQEN